MAARVFDSLLENDRTAVVVSLICVVVIAWIYLLRGAGGAMGAMEMGGGQMMQMARAGTSCGPAEPPPRCGGREANRSSPTGRSSKGRRRSVGTASSMCRTSIP